MQNQDDLRVRRTRKLLQEALFELTVEKGFAAVTIRDISERALVNRSTFYRHYLDKFDLLNHYLDELEISVSEAAASSDDALPAGLVLLIRHIQEFADFYRIMLGEHGDAVFTHRFRKLAENRYRYLFSHQHISDIKLSYIAHATLGGIVWWLANNQPMTVEALATWLCEMNMTSAGLL